MWKSKYNRKKIVLILYYKQIVFVLQQLTQSVHVTVVSFLVGKSHWNLTLRYLTNTSNHTYGRLVHSVIWTYKYTSLGIHRTIYINKNYFRTFSCKKQTRNSHSASPFPNTSHNSNIQQLSCLSQLHAIRSITNNIKDRNVI